MFWIYCLIIFVVLCTALTLLVRSRGGGGGGNTGVDNHNALQNGSAKGYSRHNGGGLGGGAGGGPGI